MRLIRTDTYRFESFEEVECPRYAILSHRWEAEEVSLQDALSSCIKKLNSNGARKIRASCKIALQHRLKYIWVDTCCIDKTSSAELSEAINSMFGWYQLAELCIAYLSDVELGQSIESSLWFTRAWTLQELIAPQHVRFYSTNWQLLGSKVEHAEGISTRTNVPQEVLVYTTNIYLLPIAQRMLWARNRKSTRVEDIAYSLLGIFDVNTPLLYGEGNRAFRRLQEEIIRSNSDQTIFLWSAMSTGDAGKLLSPSPDHFDHNRSISFYRPPESDQSPFAITNVGLAVTLFLVPYHAGTYFAFLEWHLLSSNFLKSTRGLARPTRAGLYLRKQPQSDLFEKVSSNRCDYDSKYIHQYDRGWCKKKRVHIALNSATNIRDNTQPRRRPKLPDTHADKVDEFYGCVIGSVTYCEGEVVTDLLPQCVISTKHHWDKMTRTVAIRPGFSDATIVELPHSFDASSVVSAFKLGFNFDFQPCCVIAPKLDARRMVSRTSTFYYGTGTYFKNYFLDGIHLYDEQAWPSREFGGIVSPSTAGCWFLKGASGFHMYLGPPDMPRQLSQNHCIARHEVRVRLRRETLGERTAWTFDLRITSCLRDSCSNLKASNSHSTTTSPRISIMPVPLDTSSAPGVVERESPGSTNCAPEHWRVSTLCAKQRETIGYDCS